MLARGRETFAEVTDLRLFLFANGIGILSIGVERREILFADALYLNEMMRKVFPTSRRQRREARVPSRSSLVRHLGGREETIAEEAFSQGDLIEFHPRYLPLYALFSTSSTTTKRSMSRCWMNG